MRRVCMMLILLFPCTLAYAPHSLGAERPRISILSGTDAHAPLDILAQTELSALLKELFGASVVGGDYETKDKDIHLILLGNPQSNPYIKKEFGKRWPKLSDQGQLIRSITYKGRPALVVGGGSPVATLWAVYELGHRFGIRYLLTGDHYPVEKPALKLDGFDILMEPTLRTRTWRTVNDFAIGPESWGLEEQRRLITQLAKLKFNRVMLAFYPWQPFVHFEFKGVKKSTGVLWYGWKYPVDGDTAGRAAFRGAKVFDNPDFAGKNTYEERTAAGVALNRGIIDAAHQLGMTTAIAISPLEFPKEFAEVLPGAKVLYSLEKMVVGPGAKQPPDDPLLMDLVKTQIRAYLSTYPKIDALYLTMPEFPEWQEHYEQAWKNLDARAGISKIVSLEKLTEAASKRKLIASGQRGIQSLRGNLVALDFFHRLFGDADLFKRPDGVKVEANLIEVDPALYPVLDKILPANTSMLHFVDYTARRVAENKELLDQVPAKKVKSDLILTLADDNVGVLPQLTTGHLHTLVTQLRKLGWNGFSSRYWIVGDLDPAAYYLSRASFDAKVTPQSAYEEMITAMCGDGVAERVMKGMEMIEKATSVIDEHDIGFTFPVPGVVMKHFAAKDPPPEWWKEVRTLYLGAMDEYYRGITRARQGARPWLLYHAKRLEFAFEYLNSIEAVRLAGVAKAKGNQDEVITQLEKAIESMYNALNAYGEVARDNCDRGVIAVLNEYGYRALKKELETQEKGK